jgi:regulatory protein
VAAVGPEAPLARVLRVRASARNRGLQYVDIEDAGTYRLAADTVSALGLTEGLEVDAALVSRIAGAAERQRGRTIALRLLQRRLRSRLELETALRRRGVPLEAVLAVIGELTGTGWIDDARFARTWIRDRLALRPCGRRRLRAELLAHGVATPVADEAIRSLLSGETEAELALQQAQARLSRFRGLPEVVARRRLAGWLQRRGFAPDVIARTLRAMHSAPPNHPDVDPAG